MVRPLTIIESPYAGDIEQNLAYLKRALRHSTLTLGETPFASHAMFAFFLDDSVDYERKTGISEGYVFWEFARMIAFYIDYGVSPGMKLAVERAAREGIQVDYRTIGRNLDILPNRG